MKLFANLKDAILAARAAAEADTNFDAHLITIKSNGDIYLSEGCGKNTSFSTFAADNRNDFTYNLVVSENCIFGKEFDFHLIEFCCKFNIPISNHEFKDIFGRIA